MAAVGGCVPLSTGHHGVLSSSGIGCAKPNRLTYPFTVKWMLLAFVGNNDPSDIETVTPLATPAVLLMMPCAVQGSLPAIALANAANCDHAPIPCRRARGRAGDGGTV